MGECAGARAGWFGGNRRRDDKGRGGGAAEIEGAIDPLLSFSLEGESHSS